MAGSGPLGLSRQRSMRRRHRRHGSGWWLLWLVLFVVGAALWLGSAYLDGALSWLGRLWTRS